MKKVTIIVLICFMIMLAVLMTIPLYYSMQGGAIDWNFWSDGYSNLEIVKEEELEIAEKERIEIDFKSSDVEIKTTDSDKIKVVQYSSKSKKGNRTFEIQETSESVKIKQEKRVNMMFLGFSFERTKLIIYVPIEYIGDLIIKNTSGDIEIFEELKLKDLNIKSTSGSVNIEAVEAENFNVENTSGDIEIGSINSEKASIKTTSGNVNANNIDASDIYIKTTSGNIKIISAKGKIESHSTSGRIALDSLAGKANIKTTSGDIRIEKFEIEDNSKIESTSGKINIHLTANSSYEIVEKTMSGRIKYDYIRKGEAPYNELNLKTTSGDINID